MMRKIIGFIILYFLADMASASCATGFDYCANITITGKTNITVSQTVNYVGESWFGWSIGGIYKDVSQRYYFPENNTMDNSYITAVAGAASYTNYSIISDALTPMIYVDYLPGFGGGGPSYLMICLNVTNDQTHPTIDAADTAAANKKILSENDFTKYYSRNWTFKDELTNNLINFTNHTSNLEVLCPTLSSFDINLTSRIPDGGSIIIQTIELPRNILSIDDFGQRVRQDNDYQLQDTFYALSSSTGAENYQFILQDYSGGDCFKSNLVITKTIDDNVEIVHNEKFEQDNIVRAYLTNNTYYGIDLFCSNSTRNLGSMLIVDDDLSRSVFVSRPDFGGYPFLWDSATLWLTQNLSIPSVGCTVNSTESTRGYFEVYNVSSSGALTKDYYATSTGTTIQFSKTVGDLNGTYLIHCAVNDTTYGLRETKWKITFEWLKVNPANMGTPATILGLSSRFFYNAVSIVLMVGILALFSAESMGTGAIIGVSVGVGLYYIGWWTVPMEFVGFIFFTGIFIKTREFRRAG